MAHPFAVVLGVGPGTGAAIARRLALTYPVACLARTPASYQAVVEAINTSGGTAVGISTDVTDPVSVKNAFSQAQKELGGGGGCAAAVFNANAAFTRKPFVELTENDFDSSYNVSVKGAFHFSQAALPLLLQAIPNAKYPPTLIFTGATASVKSGALMSSFSTGKFAMRALAHSVAKEYGPQGVHVAHAIIDGLIDVAATKDWKLDGDPDAKLSPDAIADAYWYLHTQAKSAFSNEIDLRPFCEKW